MKINGLEEKWQSRGDMETAVHTGIATLADRMARNLTQANNAREKQTFTLQVTPVEDYSDYLKVIDHLKKLQYVSDVQVNGLVGEVLTISLVFKGNVTTLNRLLNVDKMLVPESYSPTDTLNYRLVK